MLVIFTPSAVNIRQTFASYCHPHFAPVYSTMTGRWARLQGLLVFCSTSRITSPSEELNVTIRAFQLAGVHRVTSKPLEIRSRSWRHREYDFCKYIWTSGCIETAKPLFKKQSKGRKEMFYLTTHSTHFILRLYSVGYMVKDHSNSERAETRCRHMGYSFQLAARVLLYASSHRQDNTYHGLCYTSRGALAETRTSSMGPPYEGSIRRPIVP